MKVLGIAGWSGSGKTTLMTGLLKELTGRGLTVSTVKHAHKDFEIDQPGKDSYQHRAAGATEVLVGSRHRWALIHEQRAAAEPPLEDLLGRMSPVDLVLVEGYKFSDHDKIEVYREANGTPALYPDHRSVIAVVSDMDLSDVGRPVFGLSDIPAISEFILDHCQLNPKAT